MQIATVVAGKKKDSPPCLKSATALAFCMTNRAIFNASPATRERPIRCLLLVRNVLHHSSPIRHIPCCNHNAGGGSCLSTWGSSAEDRIMEVCEDDQ